MQFRQLFLSLVALLLTPLLAACAPGPIRTEGPSAAPSVEERGPAPPELPAPADLARGGSTALTTPFALGSSFDPLLPHAGVERHGQSVTLVPHGRFAYATFAFSLPGYSGPPHLSLGGDIDSDFSNTGTGYAEHPQTWIGLADWQRNRWSWFPGPADGTLELPSLAPYFDSAGQLLVAWLSLDSGFINWLRIGDSPWLVEELPAQISSGPLLQCRPDGTPVAALAGAQGLELWERPAAGWTSRQLADSPCKLGDLALAPDGTALVFAYRTSQPDPQARELLFERLLFSAAPDQPALTLEDYVYVIPPGPDGPGPAGAANEAELQPACLAAGPGFAAAYAMADGWHSAIGSGAQWHIQSLPFALRDLAYTPGGALRGLALTATPQGICPVHLVGTGASWQQEIVPLSVQTYSTSLQLLTSGSTWQILLHSTYRGPQLLSQRAGGWELEELRAVDGFQPGSLLAASTAAGSLRLADRSWTYTRTGWGTLQRQAIEVPQFKPWGAAFDATGRLHAIGFQGDYHGGGRIVYVRQP